MAASDVVIFATPLYFWGVSAQLKAIIDRTYSLYVSYHQPDHASLIEGRRLAMLATGAGPYENNAEPIFTAFRKLNNPHKTVNAGELYIGSVFSGNNKGLVRCEHRGEGRFSKRAEGKCDHGPADSSWNRAKGLQKR